MTCFVLELSIIRINIIILYVRVSERFWICSKILDRVVSVEYALKDDDERGDRYNDSPRRGGYGRHSPYRKSPSPSYRRRPSPDYGRPRSPVYERYDGPAYDRRKSPDYGRNIGPESGRYRRFVLLPPCMALFSVMLGVKRPLCIFIY